MKRVTAGRIYRYVPVGWDIIDPPYNVEAGDKVRVMNLPTCPKAGTMGHCHVQHLDGAFAGLVSMRSLIKSSARKEG